MLDFGAVKQLPDGMPPEIGRLLTLALAGDAAGGRRPVCATRGSSGRPSTSTPEGLLAYLEPFLAAGRSTRRSPSAGPGCRSCSSTSTTRAGRSGRWGIKLNLPPEYLLIHRVWLGGIGVLCQIGGEIPVLEVLDEHLPLFTRPPNR